MTHLHGLRSFTLILLAFAGLIAAAPVPASADWLTRTVRNDHLSVAELEARWDKLTAKQKMSALFQLVRGANYDAAQRLLDRTPFQDGAALDAKFLQAKIHNAHERNEEAVAIYRDILTNHPDSQPARIALAHTLFLMKEDESARHHFELALGSVTNRNLENNIRNFIDQMDKRKRWHVDAYVSLAPSDNFNQGSDAKIVYLNGLPFAINDEGTKKSGVGMLAGLSAGYRFAVTDRLDFVTAGSLDAKEYASETFDDYSVSAQAGPRLSFQSGHVGLYATYNRRWFAHEAYQKAFGVRGQVTKRLSKRAIGSVTGGCNWNTHDTADYYDGKNCYTAGYVDYFLTNTMYARALGGLNRATTAREHLDHDGWSTGAGLYSELPYGVSLYGELRYRNRDFKGFFPGTLVGRKDDQIDLRGTFTKRDWNWRGFAPKFEYTFTRNVSNVPFYDYRAHGANVTLTQRF